MLIKALSDSSPRVVEHAVRLAEPRLDKSPALLERVAALAEHNDVRVRFQVALSLGATTKPDAVGALATIARRDVADPWTRLAVLASAGDSADLLFTRLATFTRVPRERDGRIVSRTTGGGRRRSEPAG